MKKMPSQDLFRLIKALDKGEKRNFKLLANLMEGGREKRYLELFDMLDRQEVYSEQKLRKHFNDLYGGQLSAGKNYLHKLILRSLSHYSDAPEWELATMREQATVLTQKELFGQAEKLIRRAMREAEERECFHEWHQLIDLQVQILALTMHAAEDEQKLSELLDLKTQVMGQLENLERYKDLRAQLPVLMKVNLGPDEDFMKRLDYVAEMPEIQDSELALSISAKLERLLIRSFLATVKKDEAAKEEAYLALESLFEAHPVTLASKRPLFLRELMVRALEFASQGRVEAARKMVGAVEIESREGRALNYTTRTYLLMVYLHIGIFGGDLGTALKMVHDPVRGFGALKGKVKHSNEIVLCYAAAVAYWVDGNLQAALRWAYHCMQDYKATEHLVFHHYLARILVLLIHFDLKNYSVVESELASFKRFLDKTNGVGAYDQVLIKGMRRLLSVVETPDFTSACKRFAEEVMKTVAMDKNAVYKDNVTHLGVWLQHKVSRKTVAELLRERAH